MLKSVEGTYSNGKIELSETPHGLPDDTKVIVKPSWNKAT